MLVGAELRIPLLKSRDVPVLDCRACRGYRSLGTKKQSESVFFISL